MAPKIDKDIILAYMNKYTMNMAAKKLCIGMTTLKKHCRKNDIARWQHRKNACAKKHILKDLCKACSIYNLNRSETIFTLCTIKCNSKDGDSLMTTNEMLQEFGDTFT